MPGFTRIWLCYLAAVVQADLLNFGYPKDPEHPAIEVRGDGGNGIGVRSDAVPIAIETQLTSTYSFTISTLSSSNLTSHSTTSTSSPVTTTLTSSNPLTTTSASSTSSTSIFFHTTHTPSGCQGEYNSGQLTVTETTTLIETITVPPGATFSDTGPELYIPPSGCVTPQASDMSTTQFGGMSTGTGQPPTAAGIIPVVTQKATIKTRDIVTQSQGPAITFGGGSSPLQPQIVGQGPELSPSLGQVIHSAFSRGGPEPGSSTPTSAPDTSAQSPGSGGTGPGGSSNSGSDGSGGSSPQPDLTVNSVPVAVRPGSIVIGSSTFDKASGSSSAVQVVNGQTFTILPSSAGVIAPGGMTITGAPAAPTSDSNSPNSSDRVGPANQPPSFTAQTIDGVPFDVGVTQAVIDGKTIAIGPGAATTSIVVHGETVSLGPFGVGFPTTTVKPFTEGAAVPETTFSADSAFFSMQSGDVVIDGTTYALSKPTDVVLGTQTVSIGPGGVNLGSETVAPPTTAATAAGDKEAGVAAAGFMMRAWMLLPVAVVLAAVW